MKATIGKWLIIKLDDELKTLRSKVDHLSAQESDILTATEYAEIQPGKKKKREVDLWLTDVKQKKTELQEIDSEYMDQGGSKELKSRIEKAIKEVDELSQKRKFFDEVVLDDHVSMRVPMLTTSMVGQTSKGNSELISKWLKEDDVFVIGVHGMGGVGKTTLLKQIHNRLLQDSDISGQVYWVTASSECSLQKLQWDIGKALCLNLSEEDEERRRALIFQRLSKLRKSVLIIDDLWKHFLADKIGIPLRSGGCKIVLTTRSLDVCQKMGCHKAVKVESLPWTEAWQLFIETWGSAEELQSDITPIAEKVVEECGGLPLALVTMGCSMRRVYDVHQWRQALYDLRKPMSRQDDMEEYVFQILKFSFDSLKDEKLQSCFLSCVLYPEDKSIDRQSLIDLWIMEGMLDDIEVWQDQVDKGHAILNRLKNSNLVEAVSEDEGSYVKMHDLIRDMAVQITQREPHFMVKCGLQLSEVPREELWSGDLVKVSLSGNEIEELPCGMSPMCPNLSVLIFSNNPLMEIPDSFFVHMTKSVTVLDLSETHIVRLPDSVSDLENLRGLFLEACQELEYVPSLAKLTKLQVLDLTCTLVEAPRGMERLNSLEKITFCKWNISDLPYFNKVIESWQFYTPYHYRLKIGDPHDWDFEEETEGEKIVIITGVELGQEETNLLLPHTTEELVIIECDIKGSRSLGDILPSLENTTKLGKLGIYWCSGLAYLWSLRISPQLQIRSLNLEELPDLQGLIQVGRGESGNLSSLQPAASFSHLRKLSINRCPKIKVVFQVKLPLHQPLLPNLEYIEIWECEELEEIIESHTEGDSSSSTTITNPPIILLLPKLKKISLWNLPKLGSIYRGLLLCSSLQEYKIEDCPKLEDSLRYNSEDHHGHDTFQFRKASTLLIYDISASTLGSMPTETDNPEWWQPLYRDYPKDAAVLSDLVHKFHQNPLMIWEKELESIWSSSIYPEDESAKWLKLERLPEQRGVIR